MLYTSCEWRVEVSGLLSDPFAVTRGVRQGCSLSPLLYVLCIEACATRICMEPHIRDLRLPTLAYRDEDHAIRRRLHAGAIRL